MTRSKNVTDLRFVTSVHVLLRFRSPHAYGANRRIETHSIEVRTSYRLDLAKIYSTNWALWILKLQTLGKKQLKCRRVTQSKELAKIPSSLVHYVPLHFSRDMQDVSLSRKTLVEQQRVVCERTLGSKSIKMTYNPSSDRNRGVIATFQFDLIFCLDT